MRSVIQMRANKIYCLLSIPLTLMLGFILLSIPGDISAQWPSHPATNLPVCEASNDQLFLQVVDDGSGGAIFSWIDYRKGNNDVYMQRVDRDGYPLWTADGVEICVDAADQLAAVCLSDGSGGGFITWWDYRAGNYDVYAQKVDGDGNVEWGANGIPICDELESQLVLSIISDGSGGAIIVWQDARNGNSDIYAQRVNAAGEDLWTSNGVAVCTATDDQSFPAAVGDGSGGVIVAWSDERSANYDIYAQKIDSSGNAKWGINGVPLCAGQSSSTFRIPWTRSDGSGGAIVTWYDNRNGDYDIYAQRVNSNGGTEWANNGLAVYSGPGSQTITSVWYSPMVSDNSGGAIIGWRDNRNGNYDVYAQRINGEGVLQWNSQGIRICDASNDQSTPIVTTDGSGGAILTWADARSGTNDLYSQKIDESGEVQWTPNGEAVCTAAENQGGVVSVKDGLGGAIIGWIDYRKSTDNDIYAQRINAAGYLEVIAPAIDHAAITSPLAGGDAEIDAEITDASGVTSANLNYRQGGQHNFTQIPMTSSSDTWSAIIPGSAVTARGLEYFMTAIDDAENTARTDIFRVSVAGVTTSHSLPSKSYRMVSLPITPPDGDPGAVFSQLGSYDNTKWRFGRWNPSSESYHEYTIEWISSSDDIEPGRGYWIIVKDALSLTVNGSSTIPSWIDTEGTGYYVISLSPDWNQIGHPFYFDVDWDMVKVRENSLSPAYLIGEEPDPLIEERLFAWTGNDFDSLTTTLSRWDGYFAKSLAETPIQLLVPSTESSGAIRKEALTQSQDEIWSIKLSVKCGGSQDAFNYLGLSNKASDGWDRLDHFEPPPQPSSYLRLYFPRHELGRFSGNYSSDFRSPFTEGATWNFILETHQLHGQVELRLKGVEAVPTKYLTYLIDSGTGETFDMRKQTRLAFTSGTSDGQKQFQIVIGTQKYVEEATGSLVLNPHSFSLGQNYPNPFNPVTDIGYQIPKYGSPIHTTLKVYNILGQEVQTLVDEIQNAGYYTVTWDGLDNRGHQVPSGIYFYRIIAGDFKVIRSMVLLR